MQMRRKRFRSQRHRLFKLRFGFRGLGIWYQHGAEFVGNCARSRLERDGARKLGFGVGELRGEGLCASEHTVGFGVLRRQAHGFTCFAKGWCGGALLQVGI